MSSSLKMVAICAICLCIGFLGGAFLSSRVFSAYSGYPGDNQVQEFEKTFGILADRSGIPKTSEQIKVDRRNTLALQTILVGQQFSKIENKSFMDEARRLAAIIDDRPELQSSENDSTSKWAADARKCIRTQSSQKDVVDCVASSKYAPSVTPSNKGERTAYL